MFNEVKNCSFPSLEEEILVFWNQEDIFHKSLEQRASSPFFSFYDGPPFATGLPHYGHLLPGTIKDVIPRYKTMRGYFVPRRFGWDCHGLPIENEIEKNHNLNGAASIEAFGIENFNNECRSIVLRYTSQWKKTVDRLGRWVDFDANYKTMDRSFMESVWWVFSELYKKGLIYKGFRVMPFSAKLGTPLSNFEASENYKEVDDPSITVIMPLKNDDRSLLVWTTTPWTLPSNLACTVGPDITYVTLFDKVRAKKFILAKERVEAYYKDSSLYDIVDEFHGKELAHKKYEPLFTYFQGRFEVLLGDFVSTQDGSGIVHCAPAFGEDDFHLGKVHDLGFFCPVDRNGRFTDPVTEYKGQFVKDCDKDIIKRLKKNGRLFLAATIRHRYPFCWRSDTPLIYRAMSTWFVAVEKIKDRIIAANESIAWMPTHIKHGRFGKWLSQARDWNIARNRYWGTPIPLWEAEDGSCIVIESIEELEKYSKRPLHDLHRHHIDDIVIEKDGKRYIRIPEVFDCWFESGSMPYAQNHYPFEHRELFSKNFPADFIAEGLDQTRGWFYTLTVLGAALFDSPAFKNVVVNGIVLAEDGNKMSKRLKNYPEPTLIFDKYGADTLRLYMLSSPAVKAEDMRLSELGLQNVLRQLMIPWWNAYSFFVTYARVYSWTPTQINYGKLCDIDRWILSKTQTLIATVTAALDIYDLSGAVDPFFQFIDELCNWYIRRSRRRFWQDEDTIDRRNAFATLYKVLTTLTKVAAPFAPFISEAMYRNLEKEYASVHLCDWPQYDHSCVHKELENGMSAIQSLVSLAHNLRKEHKVKVRQPLSSMIVCSLDQSVRAFFEEQKDLIAEELNIKTLYITADEKSVVTISAKPNFKTLGKKLGRRMKSAQAAIETISSQDIATLLSGQSVTISIENEPCMLLPEDVELKRTPKEGLVAASSGPLSLALDLTLNDELIEEGLAREIINKINTQRRDCELHVSDRIHLFIDAPRAVLAAYERFRTLIDGEVLAVKTSLEPSSLTEPWKIAWDLNGYLTTIGITKL